MSSVFSSIAGEMCTGDPGCEAGSVPRRRWSWTSTETPGVDLELAVTVAAGCDYGAVDVKPHGVGRAGCHGTTNWHGDLLHDRFPGHHSSTSGDRAFLVVACVRCGGSRWFRLGLFVRRSPAQPAPEKNKEPGRAPAALRWLRRGGWASQERPCRVRSHTGRRPIDLTSSASAFSSSTETLTRLLAKALSGKPWTISHSPL